MLLLIGWNTPDWYIIKSNLMIIEASTELDH